MGERTPCHCRRIDHPVRLNPKLDDSHQIRRTERDGSDPIALHDLKPQIGSLVVAKGREKHESRLGLCGTIGGLHFPSVIRSSQCNLHLELGRRDCSFTGGSGCLNALPKRAGQRQREKNRDYPAKGRGDIHHADSFSTGYDLSIRPLIAVTRQRWRCALTVGGSANGHHAADDLPI